MSRKTLPAWAGIALMIALTLGFNAPAYAQDSPDFNQIYDCTAPAPDPANALFNTDNGQVFCSAIWKLGLSTLEVGFGASLFDSTISYDATNQLLTITGGISAIYFRNHGLQNADFVVDPNNPNDLTRFNTTTVVLRIPIGSDGKLLGTSWSGGAVNACGDVPATNDNFCVKGVVTDPLTGQTFGTTGPLLRGKVLYGTNKPNAITHGVPLDGFEYYLEIKGGELFAPYMWNTTTLVKNMTVEAFGYNPPDGAFGHVAYPNGNPFGNSFTEQYMFGLGALAPAEVGQIVIPDPCNGRIGGTVTDYFSLLGIPDVGVAITGYPNTNTSSISPVGVYSSPGTLCKGTYTVQVLTPLGYVAYPAGSDIQTITIGGDSVNNSVFPNVNFRMYASAVASASYTTFNQASWGTNAKGQNAGALLAKYFSFLYGTDGVAVGLPSPAYSLTETTASLVADLLPQEGKAAPLSANYVDNLGLLLPQHKGKLRHHRKLGSLAGETLALELNVRFSQASLTRAGLGGLKVASGPLAGKTVSQILTWANQMLAGTLQPSAIGLTNYDSLEDIVERINKNFQAGTTDNHYLTLP